VRFQATASLGVPTLLRGLVLHVGSMEAPELAMGMVAGTPRGHCTDEWNWRRRWPCQAVIIQWQNQKQKRSPQHQNITNNRTQTEEITMPFSGFRLRSLKGRACPHATHRAWLRHPRCKRCPCHAAFHRSTGPRTSYRLATCTLHVPP